jgi:hypothetical protein
MHMAEQPGSQRELSSLVDTELVRAAQEGSVSAARLIVRRHNQRLYRVARAIVRDETEAEDACCAWSNSSASRKLQHRWGFLKRL